MILGTVVDAQNQQRLSGVTVSITGDGLLDPEKTVTDSGGQFVFRQLPPGRFMIEAKRFGYLDGAVGRRRPLGPARALRLIEDERVDGLVIPVFKPAAITGIVTDEAGEPAVNMEVRAYQRVFVGGRTALTEVGTGTTDDRGIYRIGRLVPGDYVIAVQMTSGAGPMPGGSSPVTPVRDGGASSATHLPPLDGRMQKFPTTYYPTGSSANQAAFITLDLGDVRRNADVSLRPSKVMNINGVVTPTAGPARGVQIELVAAGEDEIGGSRATATATTANGGSFSLAGIPAGQYYLRALLPKKAAAEDQQPQWAEQLISLVDKDLNDVEMFMRVGSRVGGRVSLEGSGEDAAQRLRTARLWLDPASGPTDTILVAEGILDPQARAFSVTDVLPGRYILRVTTPDGWAVKSAIYQGRDISQKSFLVDGDINGIALTFTDRPNILTGTVLMDTDVATANVFAFPQDPQSWVDFGADPVALRKTDASGGRFEIRGLPAGDYFVVALDGEAVIDWLDPAFLLEASRVGTRVRLSDGSPQSVEIKLSEIK